MNFRNLQDKKWYEKGKTEGFGEGLLFGAIWVAVFGILFLLTK